MSQTFHRSISQERLAQLISVSRFTTPATTWIRGALVLQIYTGELLRQNVVLFEDRIAYVGEKEPLTDAHTQIIDAEGFTLVPGYIEPHAHSFQVYNPQTLSEFALAQGTTVLLHDNLPFFLRLPQQQMEQLLQVMGNMPVKNFWWARLDPQVDQPQLNDQFTTERIRQTLENPAVLQAGELTYWKEAINGDETMIARIWEARQSGKRIETHNPGASVETLAAVAAAGATGCHESINAEEVMRRLRLGYYATLRHSSIRPDLPELIKGLQALDCRMWDRMMLTTDGSPPFFLASGFTDHCIRLAMEAGLDPVLAYRMATLNPAVYYGLDQHLGGISPGRVADLLFLEDLRNPTPVKVMANGQIVAENGRLTADLPEFDWTSLDMTPSTMMEPRVQPDWFELVPPDEKMPVIQLVNAVITLVRNEMLPLSDGQFQLPEGYMYISLLHQGGEWITTGVIKGFGQVDALASSYTLSGDLVILGRDPRQMAQAANQVLSNRGGICLYQNGNMVHDLPLPLLGTMSLQNMDVLMKETSRFVSLMQEAGYDFSDPIYSLLFLSATHLPKVRLSPAGILDVNTGRLLIPSRKLTKQ
ncbi:adenine deaminase C-terminal domain-containing protein [Brevibacillus agri]|uniref:adenine deaminase C-terminal domain-containing protein n=1 Tax=Brevibacillus agri TaxID=51101 RepID=UPI002E1B3A82|nr:adenine deaminase C-terminal domain-containing protein [Brevibacillus agri]MED1657222.1 adenine deaminase C-terminal domain-containing protein [Brevibacillus agri]MED1689613.1 adenine deaminase C-terminal domain-containing protein [Brevibacillus agri]MED1693899.1 adenine deaminase C-terminal domain-containing protein [Brevibacillus agri]MED1698275.1 adenine deaminase C-terminal domain-containing protein [Brevibacillus agri]